MHLYYKDMKASVYIFRTYNTRRSIRCEWIYNIHSRSEPSKKNKCHYEKSDNWPGKFRTSSWASRQTWAHFWATSASLLSQTCKKWQSLAVCHVMVMRQISVLILQSRLFIHFGSLFRHQQSSPEARIALSYNYGAWRTWPTARWW